MAKLQLDQVGRGATPSLRNGYPTVPTRPPPKKAPPPLPRRTSSRISLDSSYSGSPVSDGGGSATSLASDTGRSLQVGFNEKEIPPPLPARPGTTPVQPPPLPSRRNTSQVDGGKGPQPHPRRVLPPPTPPLASATPHRPKPPPIPRTDPAISRTPPPIPRSTRPPAVPTAGRPPTAPPAISEKPCLVCYDFSGPDSHAALPRFDRTRVASLQKLAVDLTEPFTNDLEKARALFTWLHHNVSYDVHGFLNNKVASQDPAGVLRSGKAVCAGYAEVFYTLASHAGLQAEVVGGHGKGFGFVQGGSPSFSPNHAWNAVKLDWGWHLIDCCWGAGNITGPPNPGYHKRFAPEFFTSPPSVFGKRHFPENKKWQLGENGRTVSWAEYLAPDVPTPTKFSPFDDEFGFAETEVYPRTKNIDSLAGQRVTFSIGLPCEHMVRKEEWVLFLNVGEFKQENWHVMHGDGAGRYSAQVELPKKKGVKVTLCYAVSWNGGEGRGLTPQEWRNGLGRVAWGWSFIMEWGG